MLPQAVLARAVVVGADRHDARERVALEPFHGLEDFRRGIAPDADEDRHAACDHAHRALHQRLHLVLLQRGALARRAQREDSRDAAAQVVLDQPFVANDVDGSVDERRDDRQPDSRDLRHDLSPLVWPENKKARDRVVTGLMHPGMRLAYDAALPPARATAVAGRPGYRDPSRLLSPARLILAFSMAPTSYIISARALWMLVYRP